MGSLSLNHLLVTDIFRISLNAMPRFLFTSRSHRLSSRS